MKPNPAPDIPGGTEFERFYNAVRAVFKVSKEAVQKEESKLKRKAEKKKRTKNKTLPS